jgi:ATP-dependent DNA helicase RecQ
MEKYLEILKKYWGFTAFRQVQSEIIESIGEGRDTLGLMPTGGGKSITFQVPALLGEGVCLVISPLIALMTDQVRKLRSLGIKSFAIHSGLSYHEIMIALENAVHGAYKILYVSPERLRTDIFRAKVQQMPVSFITVDEAHCISQWGYDFRPSYLDIIKLRALLPHVPILALTATATPEVVNDIQDKLAFREKNVIQADFTRKNLVYFVRITDSKIIDLVNITRSMKGSGIVYLRSRKKTREIAEHLQHEGVAADFYHAGLTYENRILKQEAWSTGKIRVIVATNAFGMGIDKSDVRFVIHIDMPDSPEAYFQEAGRAGRDGKKAFAVLLTNNYDKGIIAQRLTTSFPEIVEIKRVYSAMANFLQVPIGGGKGVAYDFNLYDFAAAYKLKTQVAYNALKLLEKTGYIELTDELNNPSRIIFLLNRDDLYKFQIENHKFDGFIKLILRSYSGVFSDYTVIDEELLGKRANISRDLVYQYLIILSQTKVINYIPSRKTPLLFFTEERLDEKSLYISYEFYSERRRRFEQRLNAMLEYAFNTDECRNNLLLKYFGQPVTKSCGHCDICKNNDSSAVDNQTIEKLADEIVKSMQNQSLSLGELSKSLSIKEESLNRAVRYLLDTEIILYLDDGRLGLNKK